MKQRTLVKVISVASLIMLAATLFTVWALTSWQHTIPWDTTPGFTVYDTSNVELPSGTTSPVVHQFPYNSEQYKIKNTGKVPITINITATWIGTGTATWTVSGATSGTTFPIVLNPDVEATASLSLTGSSLIGSYDFHFDIIS